ncbi:uncharacterized protein LOC116256869 [Nymphaea colorata]|uniref:uncharacterized protein LOC116256869 n=1 Tax=Nymphaea colorata TaxID=210225 RepID=UPI00129DF6AF|nr:uncharacterized protein LOC116256869 [Nymphaea colorata]XP_031489260.1 uncharacterized protein LOC116256869 [Nymphaea colorata]XP_031489261.1 uncharacterized protein LOC116256869 [Nymphaea colorata]
MLANSKLSGYLPPGSKRLCTSLLHNEKNEVEQSLERKKFKWNTTGVSIVSDGWTDIQRRPLINFIVIARDEPIFLKAVDASGEYKDAGYLKQLFVEAIKELGPDKVVQLITDNDAVCKSAGLSLRYDFPHIFWTPCVAHTLNLALKDICNPPSEDVDPKGHELFSWIQEIEKDVRNIRNFIVNHQHALSLFSSYSDLRLLKVAETRFASIIVMLKRIQRVQDALIQMVFSREWSFYRVEDEAKVQSIKNLIVEDTWWEKIVYFLDFTEPIWCMLRAVDKDEPMLHRVYAMWENMIEEIQSKNSF